MFFLREIHSDRQGYTAMRKRSALKRKKVSCAGLNMGEKIKTILLVEDEPENRRSYEEILNTAFGGIGTYFQSLSLGVFEYVNKPVTKEEFERIVMAALDESLRGPTGSGGTAKVSML